MSRQNGHVYEFGDFRLNPTENLLLRDGEAVLLKPKVFQTLVILVEHHGRLVEKSELLEKVWEDAFVEEAAVSRCIWAIRNALGEDSKTSKYIQTVPKRGYRFVGAVTTSNGGERSEVVKVNGSDPQTTNGHVIPITRSGSYSASALALAAEPLRDSVLPFPSQLDANGTEQPKGFHPVLVAPVRRAYSPFVVAPLIGLVAIVAAVGIYLLYSPNQPVELSGPAKIAVLPLKPVNADQRESAMEFAIAESLILKISEAKSLDVKRLYAVRKFVDLDKDPIEAGRELAVDYVLASNYQIADSRIRVTSHLMNVRTGQAEKTFKTETDSGDLFKVQDTVSNEIGNSVFAAFGSPAGSYTARRGTKNEEAYGLYHEAVYLVDKLTRDDSSRAVELLDRATQLDPNFAAAWAFKAQAYCQFAHVGGGAPSEFFTVAEPTLEKALALDPNNSAAYMVRGTINSDYHWNFPEAYKDLKRSIELDPTSSHTRRILAWVYYRDERFEEAVEEQKIAIDLNPTNIMDKWVMGDFLFAAGRVDEGLAQLQRVTEIDPDFRFAYYSLWRSYNARGDTAKAYEYFIKNKQAGREPQAEIDRLRGIYETSGWAGIIRAELDLMRSRDQKGKYSTRKVYMAELAAQLGDKDAAFGYLEEAYQFRLIGLSHLKVDPLLAPLRNDARYTDLLARTGL